MEPTTTERAAVGRVERRRFFDLGAALRKHWKHRVSGWILGCVFGATLLSAGGARAEPCTVLAERAVAAAGFAHGARPEWRKRVRTSALLPRVRARATYQEGGGQYWASGEIPTDFSYRNARNTRVGIDLEWELPSLAWHRDELALSREILRVQEKRQELVAEVMQLCVEHDRLRREMATVAPEARASIEQARLRLWAQLVARGALDEEVESERRPRW